MAFMYKDDQLPNPLPEFTLDELERECAGCQDITDCIDCAINEELELRRVEINSEDEDRYAGGRDVYRNGSIIKGGGVSRPHWMDDDEWGEYRMGAEYAHEVSCQGFEEPDDLDDRYYD